MKIKRFLILCGVTSMLLFASACEDSNCTQCGYEPNSQQIGSYVDSEGATIIVSFWADANGCVTYLNCP
jgi:hypothetical protein